MSLRLLAPAKINLTLAVGPALANSRHPLDSLVGFTRAVGDTLEIAHDNDLTMTIKGPFGAELSAGADNLVIMAAFALRFACQIEVGANITLTKNLPLASGIGGGSGDAAAALIGLNTLWELGLSTPELLSIAATLGADVPACVLGQALRMTGTGETIAPVSSAASMGIVLVNPLKPCPTGPVYRRFDELGLTANIHGAKLPDLSTSQRLLAYLLTAPNDLTPAAISLVPEIETILIAIANTPNVLLSRMSGSGATCFGLYETVHDAQLAAHNLRSTLATNAFWVEADVIN